MAKKKTLIKEVVQVTQEKLSKTLPTPKDKKKKEKN